MTQALEPSEESFEAFYREIHDGQKPYLWQKRAAAELASRDKPTWATLSVPTGAGKTTLVECFLFALACTAEHQSRRFPLRLFWVVDRRSVVDQAYAHAHMVATAIAVSDGAGVTAEVKQRLAKLAAETTEDELIQVRLWRGGFAGEASVEIDGSPADRSRDDRARSIETMLSAERPRAPLSPCAAAIICSTVDQVGSRMLFRGYGISRRSRPIEAALVATDSLIVLDEAHLSAPFLSTARKIAEEQRKAKYPLPPLRILPISATHDRHTDAPLFELNAKEKADPLLAERLSARKRVELVSTRSQVQASIASAVTLASKGAKIVGVVANTVATARTIASSLEKHGDVVLIIGPSRALDRADLIGEIPKRGERDKRELSMFVVGTQTLEVGLDLDFDGLVSACAPLPALIQRFGRLDRAGKLSAADRPAHGVVVQPPKRCPIYGEATAATWTWLNEVIEKKDNLDFGLTVTTHPLVDAPPETREVDQPTAPILGPWHIAVLEQTSHDPLPDPDIGAFLHGESALDPPDVQICWRADVSLDNSAWRERIRARPPHPGELLSLPPGSAYRWLMGGADTDEFADLEGLPTTESRADIKRSEARKIVRVPPRGPDGTIDPELISPSELRPGDVIVLPTHYGGCDRFGWAPASKAEVSDLGNFSQARPRLLLSPSVGVSEQLQEQAQEAIRRMKSEEMSDEEAYAWLRDAMLSWLGEGGDQRLGQTARRAAQRLGERLSKTGRAERLDGGRSQQTELVLLATPRRDSGRLPVLYDAHVEQVVSLTKQFVKSLGLSKPLIETLLSAAEYHDLGKLDPRFQAWLNDGSAVEQSTLLAKSGRPPSDRRSRAARLASRWPRGKRHESISAMLVSKVPRWPTPIDRDLLIHLVATHHGDGRPFRHFAPDEEPVRVTAELNGGVSVEVTSDEEIPWSEHAGRFQELSARFGPWGLAALECLLVLADRGASAKESS
jgi:CRISPR-associated endonuclease/helicase Cas3